MRLDAGNEDWDCIVRAAIPRRFFHCDASSIAFQSLCSARNLLRGSLTHTFSRAEPQHHHELSSEQDAGPGATSEHHPALSDSETRALTPSHGPRAFRFAPDLTPITLAGPDSLPEGTDAWACAKGFVSITPIRAEYAGMREGGCGFASDGEGFITPGQFWAA
jgi:hypothetical protein